MPLQRGCRVGLLLAHPALGTLLAPQWQVTCTHVRTVNSPARMVRPHVRPHQPTARPYSHPPTAEAARRSNLESLLEELEADEARQAAAAAAAAARRQKKKERKKGKGGAAQQDAPADAAAEAARGAEQEPQQAQQAEAGEDGSGSGEEAVAADAAAAAQPAADAEPAGVQQPQQEAQTQQPAGPQESSGSEGPGAEEAGSEDGHQAEAEADDQHSLEALIAASARFDWSKVQGADDEQAPGRGALQAADEWRGTAPNSSRQRPTAAAGPAGKQQQGAGTSPRAQQQQQQQPPPPQRAHSAQAKVCDSTCLWDTVPLAMCLLPIHACADGWPSGGLPPHKAAPRTSSAAAGRVAGARGVVDGRLHLRVRHTAAVQGRLPGVRPAEPLQVRFPLCTGLGGCL